MTRNELEVWYTELIDRFAVWVRHQIAWIKKEIFLLVPAVSFEYRESQKSSIFRRLSDDSETSAAL